MTMQDQCKQYIFQYANEEMQRNAALFDEHKDYVWLVLKLFRDDYKAQVDAGATEYIPHPKIIETLDAMKPWS